MGGARRARTPVLDGARAERRRLTRALRAEPRGGRAAGGGGPRGEGRGGGGRRRRRPRARRAPAWLSLRLWLPRRQAGLTPRSSRSHSRRGAPHFGSLALLLLPQRAPLAAAAAATASRGSQTSARNPGAPCVTPGDVSARPARPTFPPPRPAPVARARGSVAVAGAGRAPRLCLARVSAPSPRMARRHRSPGPRARPRTGPRGSLPPHPAPGTPPSLSPPPRGLIPRRRSRGPGGARARVEARRACASSALGPRRHCGCRRHLVTRPLPPSLHPAQGQRAFHLPGGSHLGLQTPAKRGWRGGIRHSREARSGSSSRNH